MRNNLESVRAALAALTSQKFRALQAAADGSPELAPALLAYLTDAGK